MADDPNKGGSHLLKHQLPTGVDVSQFFPADKRDALHELERMTQRDLQASTPHRSSNTRSRSLRIMCPNLPHHHRVQRADHVIIMPTTRRRDPHKRVGILESLGWGSTPSLADHTESHLNITSLHSL
jgi:hypothetical protein